MIEGKQQQSEKDLNTGRTEVNENLAQPLLNRYRVEESVHQFWSIMVVERFHFNPRNTVSKFKCRPRENFLLQTLCDLELIDLEDS